MLTIRQALVEVQGETEETVTPICKALVAEGFDVDANGGVHAGTFRLVDVDKDLQKHNLNLRERNALKLVIKGAAASFGPESAGAGEQAVNLLAKFEALCERELTTAQKRALVSHDVAMRALWTGALDKQLARRFHTELQSHVNSSTRNAIRNDHGYVFDGRLGSAGQLQSSLYYVYKGAGIYCGKAYNEGAAASMEHEKNVSRAVHGDLSCPTLIKVIDAFHAGHHAVLVLPLLPKSAADLLLAAPGGVGDEATAYVCMGVLAALAALACKGWCHADIKPSNIMLAADTKRAVLVDLGACTRINERITECTEHFALGLPPVAGLQWDLACLASTLCLLGGVAPVAPRSVQELTKYLAGFQQGGSLPLGGQLALHILEHLRVVDTVDKLKEVVWEELMVHVRDSQGEEAAARLAAWWPSPL